MVVVAVLLHQVVVEVVSVESRTVELIIVSSHVVAVAVEGAPAPEWLAVVVAVVVADVVAVVG